MTSPQSQRRKNERIAIFDTRAQRDARLERLAGNDEWTGQGHASTVAVKDKSNVHREREQKGELSSDFVVRQGKQSLLTHKPGERPCASLTGPATATRPVGELFNVAAPQSISTAITGQDGDKPEHSLHRRQKSSLSAAAPVFRSQGLVDSPNATASPPHSTTSVSYQQPPLPLGNPYQPPRRSPAQDNALRPIWPRDTRSRRQKRAAYRLQKQSAQAQNGAPNYPTHTQQLPLPLPQPTAAAAAPPPPYVPPFRQVEQGPSSSVAAVPAGSEISNHLPPAAHPAARLAAPMASAMTQQQQQPMGSFAAVAALSRPFPPASGPRFAKAGRR